MVQTGGDNGERPPESSRSPGGVNPPVGWARTPDAGTVSPAAGLSPLIVRNDNCPRRRLHGILKSYSAGPEPGRNSVVFFGLRTSPHGRVFEVLPCTCPLFCSWSTSGLCSPPDGFLSELLFPHRTGTPGGQMSSGTMNHL